MLLNNDIFKKIQMILYFQKEINVIMYIIEKKIKFNFNHFNWKFFKIRYEFSKLMFL
jgi:hypothetical protein